MSKLNDLCEGNMSLKNKIVLVEKQKEVIFQENSCLKRKFCEKEKESFSKKKKNDFISHLSLHATIEDSEIEFLKNKIDSLSSTLSSCAFNHTRLEYMFSKKQTPSFHAHHHAYVAQHDCTRRKIGGRRKWF